MGTAAAQLAYDRGRTDEARTAWAEGLKQHPDALNMYLGLATLEISERRPKEAIARTLRNPTSPMPPYGNLPAEKFTALVNFLAQMK